MTGQKKCDVRTDRQTDRRTDGQTDDGKVILKCHLCLQQVTQKVFVSGNGLKKIGRTIFWELFPFVNFFKVTLFLSKCNNLSSTGAIEMKLHMWIEL